MKNLFRHFCLSLVILFLLTNCCFCQVEIMQKFKSGEPIYSKEKSIIPFSLEGHKIMVKVKINKSPKEYSFLLDTGSLTFIDNATAEELGLQKGFEMPTMNDSSKAYITKLDSISLGDMKVKGFEVPIISIRAVLDSSFAMDGFIGSDFLRFFQTTFDYQNKRIILSQSPYVSLANAKEYRMKLDIPFPMRFPTLEIKLNDSISTSGMLDTGSPYELVLPISFLEKISPSTKSQLIKSKGVIAKWPSTTPEYNYLLRIEKLKLGELEIFNLPVIFAELPKQFTTAFIGKNLLEKFLATIDYPGKELILVPLEKIATPTNVFTFGFSIRKKSDNKTYVQGLWENSPADKAGLEVEDEIIEIAAKKTSDLSLSQINSILQDDKVLNIRLKIKRQNIVKTVDLQKETLFPVISN
jgi:predicted aspartyl protease